MESLNTDPQILGIPGTAKAVPTEPEKGLPSPSWHWERRTACQGAYLKDVPLVCQLGLISSLAFLISRSVNQPGSCNIQPPRSLLSRHSGLIPVCQWKVETVCVWQGRLVLCQLPQIWPALGFPPHLCAWVQPLDQRNSKWHRHLFP